MLKLALFLLNLLSKLTLKSKYLKHVLKIVLFFKQLRHAINMLKGRSDLHKKKV